MSGDQGRVTQLLSEIRSGNKQSQDELISLVYAELHSRAVARMKGERPDHTLQPTALVNEVFLRVFGSAKVEFQDRSHFLAIASRVMRQVLVDHARSHSAKKRGGGRQRITLEGLVLEAPSSVDLETMDKALKELAEYNELLSALVEMRFYGGATMEEIAAELGVAPRTADRLWQEARLFLADAMDRLGT